MENIVSTTKSILIVGQGYVGKAMKERLNSKYEVYTYDIRRDDHDTLISYKDKPIEAILFCTYLDINYPEKATRELQQLLNLYSALFPSALFVIVSTIHPDMLDELQMLNPTVLMPEFLSAKELEQDRLWMRCVLGYDKPETLAHFHSIFPLQTFYYVTMNYLSMREAALAKLAANAFLAARVEFANSIADKAGEFGGDPEAVLAAIGMDSRIGQHYFKPSFAFSGPCLPKDTDALVTEGVNVNIEIQENLFEAVGMTNRLRMRNLNGALVKSHQLKRKVGLNRIGFAPGAKHASFSHMAEAAKYLQQYDQRATVYFYDEDVISAPTGLQRCDTLEELFQRVDVVFSESVIDPVLLKAFNQVTVVYPWTLRRYLLS